MPGMHNGNDYVCVCGDRFSTFSNFCIHRNKCSEWMENYKKQTTQPDDQQVEAERPECPYCGSDTGNWPLMFQHIKVCTEKERKLTTEYLLANSFEVREISKFEKHLAFAAWCDENDRP